MANKTGQDFKTLFAINDPGEVSRKISSIISNESLKNPKLEWKDDTFEINCSRIEELARHLEILNEQRPDSIYSRASSMCSKRAKLYLLQRGIEKCRKAVDYGIQFDPDNQHLFLLRAPLLLFEGKFGEAQAEYSKRKDVLFTQNDHYQTMGDAFLDDLSEFQKLDWITERNLEELEEIRRLLKK